MGDQDGAEPADPAFREARYLLAEETEIRDPSLYHSVLAAVAEGNATSGGIASYIGRKSNEVAHPLRQDEVPHRGAACHLLPRNHEP